MPEDQGHDHRTERAPHPDTPEWALILVADVQDIRRCVGEVRTVIKHWIGKTLELDEQYRKLEARVRKLERWREETSEDPTLAGE